MTYLGLGVRGAAVAATPVCFLQVSQGYLQPNVGGESIPTAEGELSDLAGDEPLFKALYQWCATGVLARLAEHPQSILARKSLREHCKHRRSTCFAPRCWLRLNAIRSLRHLFMRRPCTSRC